VLLRNDDRGVLLIGQASHAWISGQLARAWGNDRFGAVEPFEEVCLGAEQHDVGMARWDLAPTRNPESGLPHSFIEMPLSVHLGLWSAGPVRLVSQSRYAAVLASIHGCRLYEMRDLAALPDSEAAAIREFLTSQRAFQERMLSSLRADPASADAAAPELIARNGQLIWTWDFLSLAVCLDWAPCTARDVPTARDAVDVNVSAGDGPRRLLVEPWPFAAQSVTLRCEGRRLSARFGTDEALAQALAAAPWETVEFDLRPGRPAP
jgi:uncharacterized protein DUF3891